MPSLNRFSSRRQRLDHAFLRDRLRRATAYKRIAGYFRRSILELVGEETAAIPDVRILCNSDLDLSDLAVAWLEHGCIIFSQYYDTARWIAGQLARALPGEVVAVYAGLGKSGIYREGLFAAVDRDQIKAAVKAREMRLVVATDAACEGLNLQTLGTLINIDLPWNPSRLEQRLGRIKRFGQARASVDMLNLVYRDTRDEQVYAVISQRLKDKHDLFGGLPDTIDDEWIEDAAHLVQQVDHYIHLRDQARTAFEIRYQATVDVDAYRWERCAQVLSRRDIIDRMAQPW